MEKHTRKPAYLSIASLAAAGALLLTACGDGGDPLDEDSGDAGGDPGAVTIGSADFPESQLIASIYSIALEEAGVGVETFSLGQPSLDEVFLALTGKPAEDNIAEDAAERTTEEASA